MKEILKHIKDLANNANLKEAVQLFSSLDLKSIRISDIIYLDRIISNDFINLKNQSEDINLKKIKVAILGNYTLDTLASSIRVSLLRRGFLAEIYRCDFGLLEQDIINPKSKFYAFKPDITLLAIGYRELREFPKPGMENVAVDNMAEEVVEKYRLFWNRISEFTQCHIVQNNFDTPVERVFGELEAKYPWSTANFIRRLNLKLGENAPGYVSILDIEHLSSKIGKRCWFDDRFYYHSKQGFSFECMPEYADLFSSLVSGIKGRAKKCLVVDLDNTLWGGVIGDDGIENIKFGEGSPEGEVFLDFARYISGLRKRGVIIAICSKNDKDIAMEPFLKIREMPLKLDDITIFLANWNDKITNLRRIAQELNIGLESLLFVDDNPMERELVKKFLPIVTVVDLPKDPSLFKRTLYEGNYFETTTFSQEDRKRSKLYTMKKKFDKERIRYADIDSFLNSLNVVCMISEFNNLELSRITQLINKTNQFNLTTRRYTEPQVKAFMDSNRFLSLSVRLKDRYGDYGVISTFIGLLEGVRMNIDTWLMSCRVFSRGVEDYLFNHILEYCRKNKIKEINGVYIPTKKNQIVKNFYKDLGFLQSGENAGQTLWTLSIKEDLPLRKVHIKAGEI